MTRRMQQPRKDVLREQLALAAEEIIRLRDLLERDKAFARAAIEKCWQKIDRMERQPWWRRLLGRGR